MAIYKAGKLKIKDQEHLELLFYRYIAAAVCYYLTFNPFAASSMFRCFDEISNCKKINMRWKNKYFPIQNLMRLEMFPQHEVAIKKLSDKNIRGIARSLVKLHEQEN